MVSGAKISCQFSVVRDQIIFLELDNWALKTARAVSRRSKRFDVAGIVPGRVVSTIWFVATSCSADGGDVVGAPFDGLSSGQAGGVVFITVNQVLVRLWARRGRKSDRMWSVFRDGSSRDRGRCVQRRLLCATGSPLSPASIGGSDPVMLSQDDPVQASVGSRRIAREESSKACLPAF